MKSQVRPKPRYSDYLKFLNEVYRQVNRGNVRAPVAKLSVQGRLPGIANLMSSFVSPAVAIHREGPGQVEEWNPLFQRLWQRRPIDRNSVKVGDFEVITETLREFLLESHEANHILLLEPFFTGRSRFRKKSDFIKSFFTFEGYCFWHMDILATPELARRVPDANLFYSLLSVSQVHFHPHRAFRAIGMKDSVEILRVYMSAFQGDPTRISYKHPDIFVRSLFRRVYGFYAVGGDHLDRLWKRLKAIGIFDEFYERFCEIPNLPSLLPEKLLEMDAFKVPESYCVEIHSKGMKSVDRLSTGEIERVRLRRYFQTRAYSALSLRHAVDQGLLFSRSRTSGSPAELRSALERYLDGLALALAKLAAGATTRELLAIARKLDRAYTADVRDRAEREDLWMSNRHLIYPDLLKGADFPFGVTDRHSAEKNYRGLVRAADAVTQSMMPQRAAFLPARLDRRELPWDNDSLKLNGLLTRARPTATERERIRKLFNRIVVAPGILEQWSVPLAAVDPEKNQFREVAFRYE